MGRIDIKSMITGAIVSLSTVWWAIAQEHKSVLAQALTVEPTTNNAVTQHSPSEKKVSHSKHHYTIWPIVEGEYSSPSKGNAHFQSFFGVEGWSEMIQAELLVWSSEIGGVIATTGLKERLYETHGKHPVEFKVIESWEFWPKTLIGGGFEWSTHIHMWWWDTEFSLWVKYMKFGREFMKSWGERVAWFGIKMPFSIPNKQK